jgi:hypothetical protein
VTVLNQRVVRAQLLGDFRQQEVLIGELERYAADSDIERDRIFSVVVAQRGLLAFDRGLIEQYVDFAVAFAEEQPQTPQRQINAAFVLAWVGRLDEARRFFDPIVDVGPRSITVDQSMAFMLCLFAWTSYLLGDARGAVLAEARLEPFSGRNSCYFGGCLGPTDFALAHCALARGDSERARLRLDAALDQAVSWGAAPIAARIRLARAQLRIELGSDVTTARSDAAGARAEASRLGMDEVAARARRLCAVVGSESLD